MKHYGDISQLRGRDLPVVDVITGGSPCQDLSFAGKREGLSGARSGLFMEQIRIIKEMREHDRANGTPDDRIRPRYMVWENVPGALSSPGRKNGEDYTGKDFQVVLTEIVRIVCQNAPDVPVPKQGGWPHAGCLMGYGDNGQPFSVAWRIHDAKFWGVAQRRRRVSLIGDFGGFSAPEICFERKSLRGDLKESGEERETTPGQAERSTGTAGNTVAYGISSFDSNAMKSNNPHSGIYEADTSRTLDLNGGSPSCNQGGIAVTRPILVEMTSTKNTIVEDEICPTLTARMGTGGNQVNAICMDAGFFSSHEETSGTLLARQYKDPPLVCAETRHVVFRLTPTECERLMGFPDGWTDLGDWTDSKGKIHKTSDAARYKALGNSIALPFWFWLLRRISAQYARPATLGSLFDGIGGFPLCWEKCNGQGTAIWASEVEEFTIAVTKKRFGGGD